MSDQFRLRVCQGLALGLQAGTYGAIKESVDSYLSNHVDDPNKQKGAIFRGLEVGAGLNFAGQIGLANICLDSAKYGWRGRLNAVVTPAALIGDAEPGNPWVHALFSATHLGVGFLSNHFYGGGLDNATAHLANFTVLTAEPLFGLDLAEIALSAGRHQNRWFSDLTRAGYALGSLYLINQRSFTNTDIPDYPDFYPLLAPRWSRPYQVANAVNLAQGIRYSGTIGKKVGYGAALVGSLAYYYKMNTNYGSAYDIWPQNLKNQYDAQSNFQLGISALSAVDGYFTDYPASTIVEARLALLSLMVPYFGLDDPGSHKIENIAMGAISLFMGSEAGKTDNYISMGAKGTMSLFPGILQLSNGNVGGGAISLLSAALGGVGGYFLPRDTPITLVSDGRTVGLAAQF